jgi:hypothetical protein
MFSLSLWACRLAFVLALARLPFGLLPYLGKITLYSLSQGWLERHWHAYPTQAIRALGDLLNWALTSSLLLSVAQSPGLNLLCSLACAAEAIRLGTEKGTMALSAGWQLLPHRSIARRLTGTPLEPWFRGYCRYYALADEERLGVVLQKLRAWAAPHPQTMQKLRYVRAFRIVPEATGLRCGHVRDVARGEIFVHARWTNHPGLLYGLALRRSPWIFDPRYLPRPFLYRSQANRLMTLFVFENAALCPLYAIYQFGHEIKSARYEAFYRLLTWLGLPAEQPVRADGTYAFEPLASTLGLSARQAGARPLWSDEEVLRELDENSSLSALEIAQRYTYPLVYVEEVLLESLLKVKP